MKMINTIRVLAICALVGVLASPPAIAQFTGVPSINCSGTMLVGGTAQNAFGISGTRRGFVVTNLSTNPMWISVVGTAAIGTEGSALLAAGSATIQGGSFASPAGMGVSTALSVVSATNGDKYTCWQW